MSDDIPKVGTYTVIGVYVEDHHRFAESFDDINPGGAEDQAMAWAYEQVGWPGRIARWPSPTVAVTLSCLNKARARRGET